jgi:hypothetical protein
MVRAASMFVISSHGPLEAGARSIRNESAAPPDASDQLRLIWFVAAGTAVKFVGVAGTEYTRSRKFSGDHPIVESLH